MNLKEFESLILEYQKPIYNHVRRIVLDPDEALDCAQETFIKLYHHRAKLDTSKNLRSFMYRVATNTALDFLRKKRRLQEVPYDDNETFSGDVSYTDEEIQALRLSIDEALSHIPERYRAILLLYYTEDFSYEEISGILGIPLNTVKTHMRRAKFAVKEFLQTNI